MRCSELPLPFATRGTEVRPRLQRGSVLFITLTILSGLMLLATELVTDSLVTQRLFRNSRDKMIARQHAEAALMDTEAQINAAPLPSTSYPLTALSLPALPCCTVEQIPDYSRRQSSIPQFLYRITATGMAGSTKVTIQSVYRKFSFCDDHPGAQQEIRFGRLSWRELPDRAKEN